jgi:hypothetical protein
MGYVGNQQTEGYSQVPAKQDLTGTTGTSLTLTHAVASAEGIDLFINNVRQEPTTAYSVGADGVTVTLTGSVVATDDIYVVYNSLARQTSTHPSNQALQATSGTFSGAVSAASATTTGNVDVGGSLLVDTIKDGTGTNTGIAIDSAGIVTMPQRPMFQVRASSSTYKTSSGNVAFNLVDLDVGSNFNTSTYTFTAPVTGHYYMHSHLYSKIVSGSDVVSKFYVNGSGWVGNAGGSTQYMTYAYNNAGGEAHESVDNMAIMYLSASSTVTVNVTPSGSSGVFEGAAETWWLGYLIG